MAQSKTAELEQRIAELEKQLESRKATESAQQPAGRWYGFNEFSFTFRIQRAKLDALIKRGLVEVDRTNATTDKRGRIHGRFLYRWAA